MSDLDRRMRALLERAAASPFARSVGKAVLHRSPLPAGERFLPRRGQVMLVSYPRSGTTWTRFMLANVERAVEGRSVRSLTHGEVAARVPSIYEASLRQLLFKLSPHVIQSHACFTPAYGTTVHLIRHPVDVAASYLRQQRVLGLYEGDAGEREFVESFIAGRLHGLGTWAEHTGSWLGARGDDERHLLVRYEDLRADPARWIATIVEHAYGSPVSPTELDRVVEVTSLDAMRRAERDSFPDKWRGSEGGPTFIGSGATGGVGRGLSERSIERLSSELTEVLAAYGYPAP